MSEQKDLQEQLLSRAQECRKSVLVITRTVSRCVASSPALTALSSL